VKFCSQADLLLNVSAVNPLRPWLMEVPARALVDTDPAFTQIRHLTDPRARHLAEQHTAFFTFAENYGNPGCTVPDDGFPWQPTRQPVVLDLWPVTPGPRDGSFSTVMQWESYAAREYAGRRYGMKSDSFQPYLDLPQIMDEHFDLALGSRNAPRAELVRKGWQVIDSREPTRDPWTYQDYIRQSKAEFSVAKHGYVVTNSGWFSERSTAYMACGRPVLVEDTGFSHWLPTGRGVVSFRTKEEACEGAAEVDADYQLHCRKAAEIVAEHFDAGHVLPQLVADSMGTGKQKTSEESDLPAKRARESAVSETSG
jgi:hypothetical protein